MTKLTNIQAIRGIAALFVCVYHSRFLVNIANEEEVLSHIRPSIGIPLFYVMSGFIMVLITATVSGESFKAAKVFLLKRLIRTVPLFYFAIALLLIICHNNIVSYFTKDLGNLLRTIFFIPSFSAPVGPDYGYSLYYVSWSLNYEIFFYLIFAISLLFKKWRFHFIFLYYITVTILIPLICKGYFSLWPGINYGFSFAYLNFFTNPIQLFFVSGVLFAIIISKYQKYIIKASPALMLSLYVLALVILCAYGSKIIPAFPGSDLLICGMFVYLLIMVDFRISIPYPKFLLYLGNISYSIYLMHPLVFLYLVGLVAKFKLIELEKSWWFAVLGILIVVAVSALVHEFVEKKCIHYLKSKLLNMDKTTMPNPSIALELIKVKN